jgi:hypothetical protein
MTAEPPPDVELSAQVSADGLRFTRRPEVAIRAGERSADRDNLPRPVRTGETYHHVRAALRALGRLRGGGLRPR